MNLENDKQKKPRESTKKTVGITLNKGKGRNKPEQRK